MISGLRTRLRKLRMLPRDLFAELHAIRAMIPQTAAQRQDVAALGEQIRDLQSQVAAFQPLRQEVVAAVHDVAAMIERKLATTNGHIESLGEQVSEVADAVLKLVLQLRAHEQSLGSGAALVESLAPIVKTILSEHLADTPTQATLRQIFRAELDQRDSATVGQLTELLQMQRDFQWLLPSHLWVPETGERVRRVLSVLRPFRIGNAAKTRLGRANDGGYVNVDDFAAIDSALSLGIDRDVSWDLAIANRGIKVLQFDHTVDGPPDAHPLFVFHKTRIARQDEAGAVSIATLLRERKAAGERRVILKIDIEGDEWGCLADIDESLLDICTQIVCEFHHLHRLAEADFAALAHRCFSRLCNGFFVCHVHANNCGNSYNIGNTMIADTLEITFANRAFYEPVDSPEIFPGPIDMPNQAGRADIFLGTFRYTA
jgi:hypothetical protein